MKNTPAKATTYNSQLVAFTTDFREFENKKILEISFTNADKDTGKTLNYTKQF